MYVDSSACVRLKGGESEWFRMDSGVRQGCIISPWLFNIYMAGVMKEGSELDFLVCYMQLTWFYVVSQRRT